MKKHSQELAEVIHAAAVDNAKGNRRAVREIVAYLTGDRFRRHAGHVDRAVGLAFLRVLETVWHNGWLPYDACQYVRRHLGHRAEALLIDAIAAEAAQHAAATVHQRWHDQLREIGAVVWWDRDRPHFEQWVQRQRFGRDPALTLVIDVLATLLRMPALPRILPPPGSAARAEPSAARHGVDEKVLARVRALLAKAEATAYEEEAEALSAKAQELMNRHALERAVVDAEHDTVQSADARRLWLESPYIGAKAMLVDVVASANRCRAVSYEQLGFVTVLGDDVDLDIVELLTTSLLLQATRAMLASGRHTDAGGRSRTRSYRHSFLLSYATRIGERLREAADTEAAAVGDPRLLPVLADREKAVDELFHEMFPRTVSKSYSVSNSAGWGAGRVAADTARLDTARTSLER